MALDLNALSSATTTATALSNLILATPNTVIGYQPQNKPDTNGTPSPLALNPPILFNYEGEQSVTFQSDITDHYIEDNTAIQDQIALRPLEITTHGLIGELNDVAPPVLATAKAIANRLTVIGAYTPGLSATALLAYAEAAQAYQVAQLAAAAAVSAWSSIPGSETLSKFSNQNKQQIIFGQLRGYFESRTLFTVQTPWAIFNNMAIKSLRAVQDAETRVITDFELTFKMMRFTNTLVLGGGIKLDSSGRAVQQDGSTVDFNVGSTGPTQDFSARLGA